MNEIPSTILFSGLGEDEAGFWLPSAVAFSVV